MSSWLFELKNTGNQNLYIVISSGFISRPLPRHLAQKLMRILDDQELLEAFLEAKKNWNEMDEVYSQRLKTLLASKEFKTEDVTRKFHKGTNPNVFLVDNVSQTYMVIAKNGEIALEIGFENAKVAVERFIEVSQGSSMRIRH